MQDLRCSPGQRRNWNILIAVLAVAFVWVWWYVLTHDVTDFIQGDAFYLYTALFIVALVGAFASLTSFTIYPAILALSLTERNFFIIAIVSAAGMIVGDLVFFVLGRKLRCIIPQKYFRKLDKHFNPDNKYIPYIVFVYIALTPLPNNAMTAWLALNNYSLRRLWIPLSLGNLTLPFAVVFGTNFFL